MAVSKVVMLTEISYVFVQYLCIWSYTISVCVTFKKMMQEEQEIIRYQML